MAQFRKMILTDWGRDLISKIIAGASGVSFTKVALSDEEHSDAEIRALTALSAVKQTAKVSCTERVDASTVEIKAAVDNAGITEGYTLRTIGLYAEDPDRGEILYGAAAADVAGYVPAFNGVTASGTYINLTVGVSNASAIDLTVDPAGTATIGDVLDIRRQIAELRENGVISHMDLTFELGAIDTTSGAEIDAANRIRSDYFPMLGSTVGVVIPNTVKACVVFYDANMNCLEQTAVFATGSFERTNEDGAFARLVLAYTDDSAVKDVSVLGRRAAVYAPVELEDKHRAFFVHVAGSSSSESGYVANKTYDEINAVTDEMYKYGDSRPIFCVLWSVAFREYMVLPLTSHDTAGKQYIFTRVESNYQIYVRIGTNGVYVSKVYIALKSDIPSKLPNPKALTINGVVYDGSEAVDINVEGGSSNRFLVHVFPSSDGHATDATIDDIQAAYETARTIYCGLELETDVQQWLELPLVKTEIGTWYFSAVCEGVEWSVAITADEANNTVVDVTQREMGSSNQTPFYVTMTVDAEGEYPEALDGQLDVEYDQIRAARDAGRPVFCLLTGHPAADSEYPRILPLVVDEEDGFVFGAAIDGYSWSAYICGDGSVLGGCINLSPYIGGNGNWWIGEKDTGVKAAGEDGAQGPQGETGPQGEKGDKGDTGPQGPQGEKGDAGAQGPQGEVGPAGPQGETGAQGEKGEQGATGATGPQGPAGADGYTPVKGTDYFTEADKAEIVSAVLANFTDASEVAL